MRFNGQQVQVRGIVQGVGFRPFVYRLAHEIGLAGWVPFGTYSAAKAWVTVFSESLAVELAGTGVHVTAVCPGFTHTEFHQRADMDISHLPDWVWLDAPALVSSALKDFGRGRPISVNASSARRRASARVTGSDAP